MKVFKSLLFSALLALSFVGCDDYNSGTENANKGLSYNFGKTAYEYEIVASNPVFPVEVFTTEVSNVDRTLQLVVVDAETTAVAGDFTFANEVVIPAGSLKGTANLTFDPNNIALGDTRKVTFDIVEPAGSFQNFTLRKTTISYTPQCLDNLVVYTLILDRYGSEITWELLQGTTVIADGGPYTDGATNAVQPAMTFKYCLPAGGYTYKIYDVYGDGLYTSASVKGSYKITLGSSTLVSGNGNFGFSKIHNFTLP